MTNLLMWRCQVATSNAEMLERKKAEAAERAAEDRRITAYLQDKAAREQVITSTCAMARNLGFWVLGFGHQCPCM